MILERIDSIGLAHYSYLIGDDIHGECIVVDPRRDVDVYLETARANSARITGIVETHVHADFISGSRELATRTGMPIYASARSNLQFEYEPLHAGDTIKVADFTLEVLDTPGHTPEHISLLIKGGTGAKAPWGLFCGDTIFAGDVGRPDLLGDEQARELARQLFHTLHEVIFPLGDGIVLYPAHGEGSPCGANIGARKTTTIGYERANGELLQIDNVESFVERLLAAQIPPPSYYPRMKAVNARGPALLGTLPPLPALDAADFAAALEGSDSDKTVVIDLRSLEAFAGAHIDGALNIGMREPFPIWAGRLLDETLPIWAGWMVDPESRILLVADDAAQAQDARVGLLRIGHDNVVGYLRHGLHSWTEDGRPVVSSGLMSVHELHEAIVRDEVGQLIDVRSEQEWEQGHIPTARNIPVYALQDRLEELNADLRVVLYCGSGYRASIAASLLQQHGFADVVNVPGSISGWKAAGYRIAK